MGLQQPGAFPVYCNIHPQMAANLVVVPNPYYARVGSDGRFEIQWVPRGTWHAVVWSPSERPVTRRSRWSPGRRRSCE